MFNYVLIAFILISCKDTLTKESVERKIDKELVDTYILWQLEYGYYEDTDIYRSGWIQIKEDKSYFFYGKAQNSFFLNVVLYLVVH